MSFSFKQSERSIETAILTFLLYSKVWAWKVHRMGTYDAKKGVYRANRSPFQIKGIPDIQGIFRGRPLFIEVKSQDGRLSLEQKDFRDRAIAEGAIWILARSVSDVEEKLKEVMRNGG